MSNDLGMSLQDRINELEALNAHLRKEVSQVWDYYNKKDAELKKAQKRVGLLELVIEKLAEERNG